MKPASVTYGHRQPIEPGEQPKIGDPSIGLHHGSWSLLLLSCCTYVAVPCVVTFVGHASTLISSHSYVELTTALRRSLASTSVAYGGLALAALGLLIAVATGRLGEIASEARVVAATHHETLRARPLQVLNVATRDPATFAVTALLACAASQPAVPVVVRAAACMVAVPALLQMLALGLALQRAVRSHQEQVATEASRREIVAAAFAEQMRHARWN